MKKKTGFRLLAVLLLCSIFASLLPASVFAVPAEETEGERTPTLVDFIAGAATAEDVAGKLDRSTVPAAIDYDEAVAKNHIARLYEDEGTDLNKIIFLNIDGSKTMYTFDFPVKYVDENGNIQDIRLEIADSTTNSGEFETAASNTVTTFSANFTDGIALEGNDTEIRLIPILPSVNSGTVTMSTTNMAVNTATAQRIDENTVVYPYDAKTTVEYSLTYTGFKEDIVVSEYTGQTEYPFRLLTNGLALEEINGSFFLVDELGNIRASIGDIIIFTADERNNAFGDIEAVTVRENQEYVLNIIVDADYLADPATVYPIRIDPTVKINYNNGAGAVEDVTVSTNTVYSGTYDYLFVGRRQTEGIARILLRFPGLDLSELEGATITDAHVRIRDVMCEDTPLDVSCHIFTGNEWSESTSTTWANCSPNSYVTTPLSTNTLKWSIGNTFSNKHWYQFDVTEAVQGWVDGNYSQNKGFLFKVADSVENGSEIQNRTFGSYNRTNYRPNLTVNYTEPIPQYVENDTYYLNNRGTGRYLQINTVATPRGAYGLLSDLGNAIQWQVQKVQGGYVIRSATDNTKYLSGSAVSTNYSVNITTVSDSAIPNTCLWTITAANMGGCLIQNVASGNYLYSSARYLYTANNTGAYGSTGYETFVWRLAPLWYYGNTSAQERQELGSGFSINDVVVNIGATAAAEVNKVPTNALWANASDFTFTYTSGTNDFVTVDSFDNTFTGYLPGIATYTATHKVTGRTTTFKVYVDRYTYELTREFKFSDSDALRIREFYNVVDNYLVNREIQTNSIHTAWVYARILGGIKYDHGETIKNVVWNEIAGQIGMEEEAFFTRELGYTLAEYELLRDAILTNHSRAGNLQDRSDFAHMQISMATRLAFKLDCDGFMSGIVSSEDISHMGGWLGDATHHDVFEQTSLGNDDYHADLDAENIFRLISGGQSAIDAINTYYASLTSTNNRADVFLRYINYGTVRSKVHTYLRVLDDEVIKTDHPDTYNFLKSLEAGLADIYNYAAE